MPTGDIEKTCYNMKRLHRVFAVSSLILLAATIAMFVEDHVREWKGYQRRAMKIESRTAELLQQAALRQPEPGEHARLAESIREQRSTYFAWDRGFPWLGKRWLELPILDAFNSPRQIETIWSEDLTQDYHFREVPRYDRCTTCHQGIATGWPGQSDRPRYPPERTLTLQLAAAGDVQPDSDENVDDSRVGPPSAPSRSPVELVEQAYGLVLVDAGLLGDEQVTVAYVADGSPASKAMPPYPPQTPRTSDEIYASLMAADSNLPAAEKFPGLWMGDEIVEVDGRPVGSRKELLAILVEGIDGSPSASDPSETDSRDESDEREQDQGLGRGPTLTVRRGLPHPFASHPRLDLYLGSASPHPMTDFGCTVCHGGQGSATAFKWASHTPNSEAEREAWRDEHGWFANEFWPEPMYPRRFVESSCLRCHHRVVDLAASKRFPDPPAEKLLHGYQLILKYGCYGCHEINGYADGKTVGPDLRLEPSDPSSDSEQPGTLRKPGPSLRHLAEKLDTAYVSDWITDPGRMRPETRMPQFFGLLKHVPPDRQAETAEREAVEIQAAAYFLQHVSEPFQFITPPDGVTDSTAEERSERGRQLFQTQGCLVCHKHRDFADAETFRDKNSLVEGPDLSELGAKLRGPDTRRWLYTWLKQPARYDPRSVMPAINLDLLEERNAEGQVAAVSDPVADLVEYLLQDGGDAPRQVTQGEADIETLDALVLEHLKKEFPETRAVEYRDRGIPERLRAGLKTDELELLVSDTDRNGSGFHLDRETKLRYLGRKTVSRYGCYGCHDIPGFENAKPIGIGLNDWGRKDPRMLAFEQVADYVAAKIPDQAAIDRPDAEYYLRHLRAGNRIGFLHQKLDEPRSFDYRLLEAKAWNDRLRMPQFPFSEEEREAVMTFVLGLLAQPPRPRYVYQPNEQRLAVIEGEKVLDRYSCRGCHLLRAERWDIEFSPGTFPHQPRQPTYPFADHEFSDATLTVSRQPDRRGLMRAILIGEPMIGDDGRPVIYDDYGDELFEDEQYSPGVLEYAIQLWEPVALEGHGYQVGEAPLYIPAAWVASKTPSDGGFLTKYLLPHVVRRELQSNPNAKGSQAWGWLAPPLAGQGERVQASWLQEYLLDPYPIRPATVLRMPRYSLSPGEAATLAGYFAAVDQVDERLDVAGRRNTIYLSEAEQQYQQRIRELDLTSPPPSGNRFDQAMQIVVDKNYCVTCHVIGDYDPQTDERAKAPNLAAVHHRLRSDWVRRWIAKPVSILPYTGMPVNIPYASDQEHLGGIDQSLFPGTSIEQVDALVDLLMNFDTYTSNRSGVRQQVESSRTP